ncbi:FemAB-related protein, PEP-CTERM system-associated [Desulfacinum hydrothermale DSM 13146]|uniref:FemAB-related protein, PEP-CTERM system-associated n=1 Tax=Desulfacinum hydrothermale DSM 13146 TaxID=1121390 RepID=A0A1W1XRD1_9BACT|nr:FemAB family XrtA/PEP-CTERM system-associated protein [Desulfacinum hydrothermale]SMC26405.1 FemAB-related protein, PEP-CTERM system-associated [Desulfacinum hydrothermale DSM 13146]
MLKIRNYVASDRAAWDAYVAAHPRGTPFHTTAWKQMVELSFDHRSTYLVAEEFRRVGESPALVGVLPLFEMRSRLFGHYFLSVPFAESGGVLADSPQVERVLIHDATALVARRDAAYLELRNRRPVDGLPTKDLYVSFRKEMASDPDQNLKAIPRKSRRMVRVGMKRGLWSETGSHLLDTFYQILAANYHRLGTPVFSRRLFRNLLDAFGRRAQILVVRTRQGVPVAAVLSLFWRDAVMPYYAGSLFAYRHLAPNDFMYWELMRRSCLAGFRWFDFGRSKKGTGSYAFKKHWGFEPEPLAYQYVLHRTRALPDVSPANPRYRLLIQMWRRLPHGVTRLVGPPIARHLG